VNEVFLAKENDECSTNRNAMPLSPTGTTSLRNGVPTKTAQAIRWCDRAGVQLRAAIPASIRVRRWQAMNCHVKAIVLAAVGWYLGVVGWYLLLPPVSDGLVQSDAALGHWSIDSSYDSAKECAIAKSRGRAHIEERLPGEKPGEISDEDLAIPRQVWDCALCIGTDDPRLK
jgi:hypothetical protein